MSPSYLDLLTERWLQVTEFCSPGSSENPRGNERHILQGYSWERSRREKISQQTKAINPHCTAGLAVVQFKTTWVVLSDEQPRPPWRWMFPCILGWGQRGAGGARLEQISTCDPAAMPGPCPAPHGDIPSSTTLETLPAPRNFVMFLAEFGWKGWEHPELAEPFCFQGNSHPARLGWINQGQLNTAALDILWSSPQSGSWPALCAHSSSRNHFGTPRVFNGN